LLDPIESNLGNWQERVRIHGRDAAGDDVLNRFRAGEDALHSGAEILRSMQAL
jgi:hypothetical protein